MNRDEISAGLSEALRQFNCHRDQVSGCWSISGEKFAEKYGLDYDHAVEVEELAEMESLSDLQHETLAKVSKYVTLTDEQVDQLFATVEEKDFYADSEGVVFWSDIVEQIKAKLEEA